MNDAKKNRLMLLLLAGMLLIVGVFSWTKYQKPSPVDEVAVKPAPAPAPKSGSNILQALPLPTSNIQSMINKTTEKNKEHNMLVAAAEQDTDDTALLPSSNLAKGPIKSPAAAPTQSSSNINKPLPAEPATTAIKPTARLQAAIAAKMELGRADPYQPVIGYRPYPSHQEHSLADIPAPPKTDMLPPPPPVSPAPSVARAPEKESSPLPASAAKYSMSDNLQLVAVIGNRAVLAFRDPGIAAHNHWPPTLSLGTNERFGDLNVVQVSADSVVLDEDGTRSVKNMQAIK